MKRLAGSTWRFDDVDGVPVAPAPDRARPELTFEDDGQVFGTGGINRFRGTYTLDGDRLTFGPCRVEHFEEQFGWLGASQPIATVDGEEGHPGDAEFTSFDLVGAHRVGVLVTVEHPVDGEGVEAGIDRHLAQRVALPDGLPVAEIGLEEPLTQLGLEASFGGDMQESMGVEGVACLGPTEVELESLHLGQRG